jgi:hypothetical protein
MYFKQERKVMAVTYVSLIQKAMNLGANGAKLVDAADAAFDSRSHLSTNESAPARAGFHLSLLIVQ